MPYSVNKRTLATSIHQYPQSCQHERWSEASSWARDKIFVRAAVHVVLGVVVDDRNCGTRIPPAYNESRAGSPWRLCLWELPSHLSHKCTVTICRLLHAWVSGFFSSVLLSQPKLVLSLAKRMISRPFALQCTRCLCVCSRARLHNRRDSPTDYVSENCQVIGPIKLRSPVPTLVTNRLHCLRMCFKKVSMCITKTRKPD